MNSVRRQIVLLFALMSFLSAATIFFVTVSDNAESTQPVQEEPESEDEGILGGFQLTRSEEEGLLAQSINGLIALNKDIGIGLNVISGNVTEPETNEAEENIAE